MHRLRYLAIAAALVIGVAQSPVAASAHGGGGHGGGGGHFGGGHAFAGGRFGAGRAFAGGHFDPRFDRQFGRFQGRAIFGVGGAFLGFDFGYGLGYAYPGYLPSLVLLAVPLRLQPCRGLLLPVSWPNVLNTV
jgi:hypothetical protein